MDRKARIRRLMTEQRPRAASNKRRPQSPTPPAHPVVNPLEVPMGSGGYRSGLYRMWAGEVGTTFGYVWAQSFEDAFELWVEYLDEHAPGHIIKLDESDLKSVASTLDIAWRESWPDYDDPKFAKVVAEAESDLTLIGHTQLEHGSYIRSHEWGGDDIDRKSDEYERVLAWCRYKHRREHGDD